MQGFFDTPLLLWALKRTPGNLDRVFFERSIGLNRHFLQASTLSEIDRCCGNHFGKMEIFVAQCCCVAATLSPKD